LSMLKAFKHSLKSIKNLSHQIGWQKHHCLHSSYSLFSFKHARKNGFAPIQNLALIDKMVATFQKQPLRNLDRTDLVMVQQMLRTTPTLIKVLIDIGFSAKKIRIMGKPYSDNEDVKQRLAALGVNVEETPKVEFVGEYLEKVFQGIEK